MICVVFHVLFVFFDQSIDQSEKSQFKRRKCASTTRATNEMQLKIKI